VIVLAWRRYFDIAVLVIVSVFACFGCWPEFYRLGLSVLSVSVR
jgi:hypothetical protein